MIEAEELQIYKKMEVGDPASMEKFAFGDSL